MWDVLQGDEIRQSMGLDISGSTRDLKQRLNLTGKCQLPLMHSINQGLLPHAVPGQKQRPPPVIPNREGKHSAQMIDAVIAPFLVGMHDALGIGCRPKLMSPLFELGFQLPIVVNFPVEHNPDSCVFV